MPLILMLHELRQRLGLAIVFITHDLALAKYFARKGRIAVMYLGRTLDVIVQRIHTLAHCSPLYRKPPPT